MGQRQRHRNEMDRRAFLRAAGGAAIAMPSMAAILAACSKPGTTGGGGGASATGSSLARPDNPQTLPMNGEPIAAGTPLESGTLQVYNWDSYIYKKVIGAFQDQFNVEVEYTTFNNMEEGIQKLVAGQVKPDVFFPTTDYISRLVEKDLIQPLQHEMLPNMEAVVWKSFWDPGPWYDVGWRYTVPYTIYTTGVAYRRDRVKDAEADAQGYDLMWNPKYKGVISYYDSYRDALGEAMVRDGNKDPNSGDPAVIDKAKTDILTILNDLDGRLTINGAFAKLPEGEFTVAQSWSGDIVGGQFYLPKGTSVDVLGYWYPDSHQGLIGNDTIVVPTTATKPALAHAFLNFLLDKKWGFVNFSQWNGYQPPFTTIQPDALISQGVVPKNLSKAVVTEDMFSQGLIQGQLSADVDKLWLDAWSEIQAGG
jgi:spermidine/putrescine transport system substrate-binding protein